MADYPTLQTSPGSDPRPITKPVIDRAEDGTGRVRHIATGKVSIPVKHHDLTAAQKSTLDNFYAANKLLTFAYLSPSDNVSRTCAFDAQPSYERLPGSYWNATVQLEEV